MTKNILAGGMVAAALVGIGCGGGTPAPQPTANHAATPAANNAAAPAKPVETAVAVKLDEAGFSYVVPAGWKSETGEGYTTLSSPDGGVKAAFLIPKEGKTDATQAAIEEAIKSVVKNAKADGKPEQTTLDGMPVHRVTGTGEVDGKQVQWLASRIEGKKTVFIIAYGTPADVAKHQAEIDGLRASVKKIG